MKKTIKYKVSEYIKKEKTFEIKNTKNSFLKTNGRDSCNRIIESYFGLFQQDNSIYIIEFKKGIHDSNCYEFDFKIKNTNTQGTIFNIQDYIKKYKGEIVEVEKDEFMKEWNELCKLLSFKNIVQWENCNRPTTIKKKS